MDVSAAEARRLVFWNRFWLGVLLVGMLREGARWVFITSDLFPTSLRVFWSQGGLRLSSASDGPFVVTGPELGGGEAGNEGNKAVVPFTRPVVIIDSDGATITPAELKQLTWRGISGGPVPPPPEGAPIRALYFRPLVTPPALAR
jgi:hypothetical protein